MYSVISLLTFFFTICQEPDTLVPIYNLNAFTHPKFLFSSECECSRYDFEYFHHYYFDSLIDTIDFHKSKPLMPPNLDVGHDVSILAKQGSYFKVKLLSGAPNDYCQDLVGNEFWIKKGELGTWIYNFNDSIPLYEKPSLNSKIITKVEPSNSVAVILDIVGDWMLVETIGKQKEKGWLCPKNQCGNPYGVEAGSCN